MSRPLPLAVLVIVLAAALCPAAEETLLLQEPTISKHHVVFVYARDLWLAPRAGGEARRLTSHVGRETTPHLSPDGKLVAFSGQYEGNTDVYVIPVSGGTPKRLTWHPRGDVVKGWHPDGRRVLFSSGRGLGTPSGRLFLVPAEGGQPEPLVIPRANHGAIHPDGDRVAYTPFGDAFGSWKRYRGGRTTPVWILDLASHEVEVVPHVNASDTWPCWIGEDLYFASDRSGQMNVWRTRPGTGSVEPVTEYEDLGVRRMSAGAGVLVFERGGAIHVFDPETKKTERLSIVVRTDGLQRLPRWQAVKGFVRSAHPSPNGQRAVFEARGEIVTVPREHGDARNLSRSPGAHDRSPAWCPDGTRIAWFSDASGEYRLVVRDRLGREPAKTFALDGAGFYHDLTWSPDGKRILFNDKANRIATFDLETEKVATVSRTQGSLGAWRPTAVWSPDSKWIAFERKNPHTAYTGVSLFEVATGETTAITDGFAHAGDPAFSGDGKHLFFVASVNSGPRMYGLNMSVYASRRNSLNLYVAVLKADGEHPLAPRSDDEEPKKPDDVEENGKEKPDDEKENEPDGEKEADEKSEEKDDPDEAAPDEEEKAPEAPSIDREGLDQRILALPVSAGTYWSLQCVKDRLLYLSRDESGNTTLRSFDFESRKAKDLAGGVSGFAVAHGAEHLLVRKGSGWSITSTAGKDGKPLRIDAVRVRVEPEVEWPQILREAWRIQRDYFYDPNLHHVDWDAMWVRWSAFLPHVRHRDDLNLLLAEMIGELCCGHEYAGGGDAPGAPSGASVGLLGADFRAENDRYRIARIYRGQNWDTRLRSPLTEPGVDVREGDFLLSVDGRPVTAAENLHAAFEGTAGRQIEIAVSDRAEEGEVRVATVVPLGSDFRLRRKAWVEANRKRVDELSGGRLAYVYLPNTGGAGMAAFDRDFYSQVDRQGIVLDERFNGGGLVADYIVSVLDQKLLCYWMNREGWVGRTPFGTFEGPKVMLINEQAGSGGDCLPWMFRRLELGTLVGTRTWGGLVGISGNPGLVDGGRVSAANFGIMDTNGEWVVENVGVAPDVQVIQWPKDVIAGRDPQLEKAVKIALDALEKNPQRKVPEYRPPAKR